MKRFVALCLLAATVAAEPDPYLEYVKTAREFAQVPHIEPAEWNTWVYMPWYYKWALGYDDAAARFCRENGINGGFTDHGRGPIEWLRKHGLRFYNDHTAGKGLLHVHGSKDRANFKQFQRDPRAVRNPALNGGTLGEALRRIRERVPRVRDEKLLIAYALDDEASTGAFVVPIPWRAHDNDDDYRRWLARVYGRPVEPQWVTPKFTRHQLERQLRKLDFAPLLDRMSYNDSEWAIFLGALVEETNRLDPARPAGLVGCQSPNLWGGYDYAKLCRKLQFAEPYDSGSAPEIVRSLTRGSAPLVTTHFHREDHLDSWKAWRTFAHGQRGMIAWVDRWFDDGKPKDWIAKFAPTLKELGGVQGPKMHGARWRHDGIAIYYSHPSIQVSWILDSEPHGKTWPNRGSDDLLGTSHNVRRAWEYLLNDGGLQYDFVAYDEVIVNGVPAEYEVLILPACYALSDVEARRIGEFAARGGRVVADFMCGLFDQHGKGRTKGALDDLFGVKHDGTETAKDFFADELWVETDQEDGFGAERWRDLFTGPELPEKRIEGNARYLNRSPQRYLMHREEAKDTDAWRAKFLKPLGVEPWVRAQGDARLEVTYFEKDGRTLLFVVQNPVMHANGKRDVRAGETEVTITFASPARKVRNERTGKDLGAGSEFKLPMQRNEALFLSLE